MKENRSLIKKLKKIGPRIGPWAKPDKEDLKETFRTIYFNTLFPAFLLKP